MGNFDPDAYLGNPPSAGTKSPFVIRGATVKGVNIASPEVQGDFAGATTGASTAASESVKESFRKKRQQEFFNAIQNIGKPIDQITDEDIFNATKGDIDLAKELKLFLGRGSEGSSRVPADKAMLLAEGSTMPKVLEDLGTSMKSSDAVGPIAGLRKYNPWDVEARSLQAKVDATKQLVGRFLEGGVLRKEDEEKYKKILAQMTDDPKVVENKITELNDLLASRYNAYLDNLGNAGYDIKNFPRINLKSPDSSSPGVPFKSTSANGLTPDEQAELDYLEKKYGGR